MSGAKESGSEVSSTSIRLFAVVVARCPVGLVSTLLFGVLQVPSFAQESSDGIGTTVPTLRGSLDSDTSVPALFPGGTTHPGIGSAVTVDLSSGNGKTIDAGSTRFALPKNSAKTRDRMKLPRKGAPPLPTLQAYPTSSRLRAAGALIDTLDSQTIPGPTVAALPVTTRPRTRIEDKAYDPVGIEFGSLRLTPYVTQSFGYDSNPDQTHFGIKPSAFSRTEGGLGAVSQWSSNELRADLRGGYNDYFRDPQANRPDAIGTIDLRVDANRDTVIDAEQRFNIDTQRPSSPEVSVNTVDRPLIATFGETLGATESFGRTSVGVHGSFDRTAYDNAVLSDGTIEDLAKQNFSDYGLRLRAAYEMTPAVRPFVDVLVDRRIHDATVDLGGFARDSNGIVGQVGSSFEFNRLFAGELSAGYGDRTFQDRRLKDINGPVLNGAVSYSVTPLTLVSLRAATNFDETTVLGASGAEARSATLEVAHQLLRNLTVTGAVSYLNTQYVGAPITENTLAETLKAEYHLSRSLVATATYNHQRLSSTALGSSFSQDVFLVGLRVQR